MQTISLNLVVLRSSDIKKAAEFYHRLGLDFQLHQHGAGPQHYSAQMAGVVFEIYTGSQKNCPKSSRREGMTGCVVRLIVIN